MDGAVNSHHQQQLIQALIRTDTRTDGVMEFRHVYVIACWHIWNRYRFKCWLWELCNVKLAGSLVQFILFKTQTSLVNIGMPRFYSIYTPTYVPVKSRATNLYTYCTYVHLCVTHHLAHAGG